MSECYRNTSKPTRSYILTVHCDVAVDVCKPAIQPQKTFCGTFDSNALSELPIRQKLGPVWTLYYGSDLNRPKGFILSPLPSGEQQTDDLLNIVAWPKDKIHFLCAAYHILQREK